MKPFTKVGSFLLAVLMVFTAVAAVGCTPISLSKQWSYKTSDNELSIGVYIYALSYAYNEAMGFAQELDDYEENSDSWLEMEITDDDGNKEVADTWIKNKADELCMRFIAVDSQINTLGIELDQNEIASADETAENYWNVGPYADYGYIMPLKDNYEPYGISLESFQYGSLQYDIKYKAVFDSLYNKGGSKEVSDSDLTEYFKSDYASYSYFSVSLSESTTDEAGESKTVALEGDALKKVTDEIDGYVEKLNNGTSYDDIINEYMTANAMESDPSTTSVENLENSTMDDQLKEAYKKLEAGKAQAVKIGEGEEAMYYLLYKRDINDSVDEYINNADSRDNILFNMKEDEFWEYIDGVAKDLGVEKNEGAINKYKPKMFFEKSDDEDSEDSEE